MPSALRWGLGIVALCVIPFVLQPYELDLYRKLLFWVALALSFNFLFGITGQIALSHFAFAGIGAYAVVILLTQVGLPLPIAILAALTLAAVLAFIVSFAATRLEGFYLALATLAFAQLLIVILDEGGSVTGGVVALRFYLNLLGSQKAGDSEGGLRWPELAAYVQTTFSLGPCARHLALAVKAAPKA